MTDGNKPVWLILSHAFNMDGRAASQTITDKIPHLLNLSIEPVIVSGILGKKDAVLEHHQVLPALAVALRFDLRHYFKQRLSKFMYRVVMLLISLILLPFYLIEKLILPIETSWSWAITAYFTSAGIIKKRKPAIIYSTGGAYAAHLAGYWLSRRFGLPWIAEIHDPMVLSTQPKNTRRKFMAWLEKIICTHADVVWWFTEEAMQRAKQRHPQLGERGHYVLSGVDAPSFTRTPYQRQTHLSIGHFGSLSNTRNLQIFLQALHNVIEQDVQRAKQIQLHVYGGNVDSVSAQALAEFPYPEVIKHFGRLETDPVTGESGRDRVLKRMNAVDCLLLLHGIEPFCEEYIPSKMFEYLWTQRPILALIHRNPQLTGILRDLGHWTVAADNVEAATKALEELYARWMQNDLADSGKPSPYTTYHTVQMIHSWTLGLNQNLRY